MGGGKFVRWKETAQLDGCRVAEQCRTPFAVPAYPPLQDTFAVQFAELNGFRINLSTKSYFWHLFYLPVSVSFFGRQLVLKMLFLVSGCDGHLTITCRFSACLHFCSWLQFDFFFSALLIRLHIICLLGGDQCSAIEICDAPVRAFGTICFETSLDSTLCWPGALPVACSFASSVQLRRCCWLYSDRLIVLSHAYVPHSSSRAGGLLRHTQAGPGTWNSGVALIIRCT